MNKHRIFKRIISVITILMLITTSAYAGGSVTTAAVWNGYIATSFNGGSGTSANPYIISTPEQLAYLASLVNSNNSGYNKSYYKLTEDINLGGREWTPIGKGVAATDLTASSSYAFMGVFDGDGHTVSNFKITASNTTTDTSYVGLFGNIYGGNTTSVANLNVADFTIDVTRRSYTLAVGGLAGACYGVISSCGTSGGTITAKTTGSTNATCYAGGLVGRNQGGAITKCYARTNVTTYTTGSGCHSYAGGLVGYITSGSVTYSYATGNVSATSEVSKSAAYAGGLTAANQGSITCSYANGTANSLSKASTSMAAGLVAYNTESGTINTSYATGNVTSAASSTTSSYGGGLVANMQAGTSAVSCFATGNVSASGASGKQYAGGFAGASSGTLTDCYYTTSQTITPSSVSLLGKAAAVNNLSNKVFFTSRTYFTTVWNFTADWALGVSGSYVYPTLIAVPHAMNWSGDTSTSFSGGNGTIGAPYEIATSGELALLANNVNNGNTYQGMYFKLTSDIDLHNLEWIPIGRGRLTAGEPNAANAFCGSFDGGNHTISNFTITTANTAYTGLFGVIYGGAVSNLKVTGFTINVTTPTGCIANAGGIAGANTGAITNCMATGSVTASSPVTGAYAGGIVGRNESGIVSGSTANVIVTSITTADSCHAFAGGLVGYNNLGTINTSCSTGDTTALTSGSKSASYAGGLTAMNQDGSVIMDCYSNSNISSTSDQSTAVAAGLVAHNLGEITTAYSTGNVVCNSKTKSGYGAGLIGNHQNTAAIAKNCFSVSNVTLSAGTNKYVGNLMGTSSGTITNCYYTSTQTVSPVPTATYGKVVAANNLTKQVYYTNINNFNPVWNMTTIWTIGKVEGYSYPTFISSATDTEPEPPVDDDPNIDPDGWDGKADEKFAGGSGTSSSPYQIATPGQLLYMANQINEGTSADKYYILTDNINLNHRRWTPIGISSSEAFKGSFDGNGYTIDNLKIISHKNGYAGLFGYVQGGTLSNIIVNNVKLEFAYSPSDNLYAGAIAAYSNGAVLDCFAEGKIKLTASTSASQSYIGGIVGYGENGSIKGCTSQVVVDTATAGITNAGGIAGYAACDIEKCAARSDVTSTSGNTSYTGGVVGYITSDAAATDCYSMGIITGGSSEGLAYSGGLAGYNLGNWITSYSSAETTAITVNSKSYAGGLFGYSNGTLTSCYAVNNVTAISENNTSSVGGLIGNYAGGSLNNCYRSDSQTLDADSVNTRGVTNTIANLTSKAYLTNTTYFKSPWDFDNVWQFKTATGYAYPVHKGAASGAALDVWEGTVADSFAGGSGTRVKPYQIANAPQLAYLAYLVNTGTEYSDKYYELTADIDLSESVWIPIGKGTNVTDAPTADKAFCGVLEGNGYTIKNVTVSMTDKSGYGLFGSIYNAVITNLKLDNINISITAPKSTNVYAGGVAGISYGSEISFVRTSGGIKVTGAGSGNVYAGGITGGNYEGLISVAYSTADVNANSTGSGERCLSGGIVGYNSGSEITDCYYSGKNVKAITMGNVKAYSGGIAGLIDKNSKITTSYSAGEATASSYVADSYAGGIAGYGDISTVEALFATGNVTASAVSGNEYGGGIIGKNNNTTVTKCYKSTEQAVTADTVNTESNVVSTSASNFTQQFLTNTALFTTVWDFADTWESGKTEGYNYPTLQAVPHIPTDSSGDAGDDKNDFYVTYNSGILNIRAEAGVNNAVIILVAYYGNNLINTEILIQNISQGENLIFPKTFTTTGADRIKVMLWNSTDNQSELGAATEIIY